MLVSWKNTKYYSKLCNVWLNYFKLLLKSYRKHTPHCELRFILSTGQTSRQPKQVVYSIYADYKRQNRKVTKLIIPLE